MKNIFVMALGDFNHQLLKTIRDARRYRFYSLLSPAEIVGVHQYDMNQILERASKTIEDFDGKIDAIVSYWDFPSTLMLPTLRRLAGLPSSSTESILRCVHKYWSRIVQRESVPEMTPKFAAFNPFTENPLSQIKLDMPFWIKPVKAHSSVLGFRIETRQDFETALPQIRKSIKRFSTPFNIIFSQAEVPKEIALVDGSWCLAEEIISARNQCTLEGYVLNGRPHVYGAVDSLREKNRSSFSRYHYPTRLPKAVLERMVKATERVMQRIGLVNEPFNIEFFHDPDTDRISLLEINPRISKSHCPLFYLVEGASHQEVMVEVAMGLEPNFPRGRGAYPMATKFMLRRYAGDALVLRCPHQKEIEALQRKVDGTLIKLWVKEGDRLSDFADQDSYSFEYANVFIGGRSENELQEKFQRCMDLLPFRFKPMEPRES